jgi:hypothetical protein
VPPLQQQQQQQQQRPRQRQQQPRKKAKVSPVEAARPKGMAAGRSSGQAVGPRTAFNPAARGSGHALQLWGQEGGPNISHVSPLDLADDAAAAELDVEADVREQKLARR